MIPVTSSLCGQILCAPAFLHFLDPISIEIFLLPFIFNIDSVHHDHFCSYVSSQFLSELVALFLWKSLGYCRVLFAMKIINRLNLGSASLFFLAVLYFSFFVWIFRIRDSLLKCFAALGPASKSDNWRKLGSPFSGDFISLSRVGTVSKILSSSTSLSSDEFYSACCFIYSFNRPDNWGKLGVLSIAIESHRVIFSSSYANFDSLFLLALQLKTFTVAYILFVFDWSSSRDSRLYFLFFSSFRVHISPGRCKWHHSILLLLLSVNTHAPLLHSPFHNPRF